MRFLVPSNLSLPKYLNTNIELDLVVVCLCVCVVCVRETTIYRMYIFLKCVYFKEHIKEEE